MGRRDGVCLLQIAVLGRHPRGETQRCFRSQYEAAIMVRHVAQFCCIAVCQAAVMLRHVKQYLLQLDVLRFHSSVP